MPYKANKTNKREIIVLTFGTFDLFHIGHLNILRRGKQLGTKLVVGVSSDALNFKKKAKTPTIPEEHRMQIVKALSVVDEVFLEESLELKGEYIERYSADVVVMGNDWTGRFDHFADSHDCKVIYLPRTPFVSSTQLKKQIQERRE